MTFPNPTGMNGDVYVLARRRDELCCPPRDRAMAKSILRVSDWLARTPCAQRFVTNQVSTRDGDWVEHRVPS